MSEDDLYYTLKDNVGQNLPFINETDIFKTLDVFNEIYGIIKKNQDNEKTLSFVLDRILDLTGMERGGIYLLDKDTGDYVLTVHSHISEEFKKIHRTINKDWKSLYPVIYEGKTIAVSDTQARIPSAEPERQNSVINEGFRSYASIPLVHDDSIDGILMVGSSRKHNFSEIQKRFFSIIGRQVGCSLQNANLIKQLIKSNERYYNLFYSAGDIIYTHDIDGNFLSMNQTGLDLLECSEQEILSCNVKDFLTEESQETACAYTNHIIQGYNISLPPILEVISKNGKRAFIEFNIQPIIENGETVGFQGIARNVDKRLCAEENMLVFSKAINQTSDGINISDDKHNITFINEAGARLFGYSRSELTGQPVNIFYAEEDLPNLLENVIPAMEKYGYWNGLVLGRKKDGTTIPVEVNLSSAMDENGKPLANIGVFRERKSNI